MDNERQLLSLPTRYCGLAIRIFFELAETEFENLHKITLNLTPLIINQSSQYNINESKAKQLKQDIKGLRKATSKAVYKN